MTIEITISPQGETTLETKGTTGPGCQEMSRFLEYALGQTVNEQRTSDYYITTSTQTLTDSGSCARTSTRT